MDVETLLHPTDVDAKLRYPTGRSARLARRGLMPCIFLPDGEVRFDPEAIDRWLAERARVCGKAVTDDR